MQQPQERMKYEAPCPTEEELKTSQVDMKLNISRSVGTIVKVPKCHQMDAIEQIEPKLDSTLTGKMDYPECAVVIWMLTNIRPDFKVCDMRCDFYEELFSKYKNAAARIKDRIICFVSYPTMQRLFCYIWFLAN